MSPFGCPDVLLIDCLREGEESRIDSEELDLFSEEDGEGSCF